MEYRNDKNAKEFFTVVATYYFIIGVTMMVVISIFSYEIVLLVAQRKEYMDAFYVIPIIMLAHIFYGSILDSGIIFERKVMWDAYILMGAVSVSILLNYIFIPMFGYLGSAFIALFIYFSVAFVIWRISNKFYVIELEVKRIASIVLSGVVVIVIAFWINGISLLSAIALKLGLILLFLTVMYFLILRSSERNKIALRFNIYIKNRFGF